MQDRDATQTDSPRAWLKDGEFPTGPFTREQLRSQLTAGEISASSYVCMAGSKEWLTLATFLDSPSRLDAPSASPTGDLPHHTKFANDRPVSTTSLSTSAAATNASAVNPVGAWLLQVFKLATLALIGYVLFIRPWRQTAPPRSNSAVHFEEEQALRAEYEGRSDDAEAYRRRAQEERAFEDWKRRQKQ